MLKVQSLRELTRSELLQKKFDLEDEQFNLHMRRSLKALDNPLRLRQLRREIARINTVLSEDTKGIHKLAETSTSILNTRKDTEKKGE
ncbi:MAG TPA: 50S ribosomal protein L29 [candidate division Zixibacteria bacterium]|nr:50S ribosomal protein L29 [candidate division Zixibacteria bacterium]